MAKGRVSFAKWEPIRNRSLMSNNPVRMTVHLTAVRANDIYGPGKGPGGTYAHFHNSRNGDLRQHQQTHRRTYADLRGNGKTISVENEGKQGDSLTDAQIENLARLFAVAVNDYGVPNRIATARNTKGLAWHRLGVRGNFGSYNPNNRKTWNADNTGELWSTVIKTCPTDNVIDQIDDIYSRAQHYIKGGKPSGGGSKPSKPSKKPAPPKPSKPHSPRKGPSGQGKAATKSIQRVVKRCNYYDGKIDGDYGPMTKRAVKDWQSEMNRRANAGLVVDGDWGQVSRNWLNWVKKLQRALPKFKGIKKLRVDGDYGSITVAAVRTLQRRNGLYVDGVAGAKTITFMQKAGSKITSRPSNRP